MFLVYSTLVVRTRHVNKHLTDGSVGRESCIATDKRRRLAYLHS